MKQNEQTGYPSLDNLEGKTVEELLALRLYQRHGLAHHAHHHPRRPQRRREPVGIARVNQPQNVVRRSEARRVALPPAQLAPALRRPPARPLHNPLQRRQLHPRTHCINWFSHTLLELPFFYI